MKKRLLQMAVVAFGLSFGISSCSKDEETVSQNESKVTEKSYPFVLNLEAEGGASDLSLGARNTDLRALKFEYNPNTNEEVRLSESSSWQTHVYLKKADGSALGYVDYEFVVDGRGAVDSRGVSVIKLKPLSRNVTITMFDGAQPPTMSEVRAGQWYISGVAGGGERNGKTVTFAPNEALDATLTETEVRAPLVFQWTKLIEHNAETMAAKVTLKPQGVLLRVSLTNLTGHSFDEPFYAGWLEGEGGNIYEDGIYDFGSVGVTSNIRYTSTRELSEPLKHAKLRNGRTAYRYVWAGLTANDDDVHFSVEPTGHFLYRASTFSSARKEKFVYDEATNTLKLSEGKRALLGLMMEPPTKMPIEYVSDYNLKNGPTMVNDNPKVKFTGMDPTLPLDKALATESENAYGYGYYMSYVIAGRQEGTYNPTGESLLTYFNATTLPSEGYRLPEAADYWGVFPWRVETELGNSNTANKNDRLKNTSAGEKYHSYLMANSEWTEPQSDPEAINDPYGTVVYGIRFKPRARPNREKDSGYSDDPRQIPRMYNLTDNSHLSAFRIRRIGDFPTTYTSGSTHSNENNKVIIESVYLGESGASTTLAEVSNPAWWSGKTKVKKVFHASGHIWYDYATATPASGRNVENIGQFGVFMTTTVSAGGNMRRALLAPYSMHTTVDGWHLYRGATMRLFLK